MLFQILKTYIMKLPVLLCALVLSVHGWCASVAPLQRTSRATSLDHRNIKNGKLAEEIDKPLLLDKMKTALIVCGIVTYLTVIIWWAVTAKNSLDRILKNVIQDIGRYP